MAGRRVSAAFYHDNRELDPLYLDRWNGITWKIELFSINCCSGAATTSAVVSELELKTLIVTIGASDLFTGRGSQSSPHRNNHGLILFTPLSTPATTTGRLSGSALSPVTL